MRPLRRSPAQRMGDLLAVFDPRRELLPEQRAVFLFLWSRRRTPEGLVAASRDDIHAGCGPMHFRTITAAINRLVEELMVEVAGRGLYRIRPRSEWRRPDATAIPSHMGTELSEPRGHGNLSATWARS